MSTTTYERIWRNVVACAAAILVLPSPAWALDISNSFLKTDLVGYFPFNGNANDESSFGNNGVLNGPALGTNRFGYRSNSFVFASVGSFIRTSGSAGLPLST